MLRLRIVYLGVDIIPFLVSKQYYARYSLPNSMRKLIDHDAFHATRCVLDTLYL
jgi:hypothetical protein